MFYTPAPIVDYLVATTLAPLLRDRRPEEVLQLRVLDPSCGCGAFLIACYRYVLTWLEHHPDCDNETARRLSLEVIERVLCGCDIDPSAVSWSIRLQLLAAWETLRSHTNPQPFVPPNLPRASKQSLDHYRVFAQSFQLPFSYLMVKW